MTKIETIIDGITGITEERIRMREQFIFLREMARAKSETFENRLKLMLSNKEAVGALEIMGGKAFEYRSGQHVNITSQCDDAIAEAIDEVFKGHKGVKAGFQKLVKKGLSDLIGNTSIGETEEKVFFVYPEDYSIVRVDVMAYKYTFSSRDVIANDMENLFVYTLAKSCVDYRNVSLEHLMNVVVGMLGCKSEEDPTLEQCMPYIRVLQMGWKMQKADAIPFSAFGMPRGPSPADASILDRIREEVRALTPHDVLVAAERGASRTG